MDNKDHIVEFDKYCSTCQYKNVDDTKGLEPCNECLANPINTNSRKPINYKKIEENKKAKENIKKEL